MDYKVIRSSRKTVAITINKDKEVVVRSPLYLSENKIADVVKSHKQWLIKKIAEIEEKARREEDFRNSGLFILHGRELHIKEIDGNRVKVERSSIYIGRTANMKRFYKRELEPVISQLVEKWQEVDKPKAIIYRNQKTLWGSCTHDGVINLNILLIKAPYRVIEYVYLHEMVHLRIKNHGKDFWRRLEGLMPDYKEAKKWLKLNGHFLFL